MGPHGTHGTHGIFGILGVLGVFIGFLIFYGVFRGLEWFHDVPGPPGMDSGPGIPENGGMRVRLYDFGPKSR